MDKLILTGLATYYAIKAIKDQGTMAPFVSFYDTEKNFLVSFKVSSKEGGQISDVSVQKADEMSRRVHPIGGTMDFDSQIGFVSVKDSQGDFEITYPRVVEGRFVDDYLTRLKGSDKSNYDVWVTSVTTLLGAQPSINKSKVTQTVADKAVDSSILAEMMDDNDYNEQNSFESPELTSKVVEESTAEARVLTEVYDSQGINQGAANASVQITEFNGLTQRFLDVKIGGVSIDIEQNETLLCFDYAIFLANLMKQLGFVDMSAEFMWHFVQSNLNKAFGDFFGKDSAGNPLRISLDSMKKLLAYTCVISTDRKKVEKLDKFKFSSPWNKTINLVPDLLQTPLFRRSFSEAISQYFGLVIYDDENINLQGYRKIRQEIDEFLKKVFTDSPRKAAAQQALASAIVGAFYLPLLKANGQLDPMYKLSMRGGTSYEYFIRYLINLPLMVSGKDTFRKFKITLGQPQLSISSNAYNFILEPMVTLKNDSVFGTCIGTLSYSDIALDDIEVEIKHSSGVGYLSCASGYGVLSATKDSISEHVYRSLKATTFSTAVPNWRSAMAPVASIDEAKKVLTGNSLLVGLMSKFIYGLEGVDGNEFGSADWGSNPLVDTVDYRPHIVVNMPDKLIGSNTEVQSKYDESTQGYAEKVGDDLQSDVEVLQSGDSPYGKVGVPHFRPTDREGRIIGRYAQPAEPGQEASFDAANGQYHQIKTAPTPVWEGIRFK